MINTQLLLVITFWKASSLFSSTTFLIAKNRFLLSCIRLSVYPTQAYSKSYNLSKKKQNFIRYLLNALYWWKTSNREDNQSGSEILLYFISKRKSRKSFWHNPILCPCALYVFVSKYLTYQSPKYHKEAESKIDVYRLDVGYFGQCGIHACHQSGHG